MNIETTTIACFADLLDACEKAYKEFNGVVWYRGHENITWQLQPSVFRPSTYFGERNIHYPYAESNMTHKFRIGASLRYPNCPAIDDYAAWLGLMQHHGLPTRLLDWSESAAVALFFAMEGKNEDKALWLLSPLLLNESTYPKVNDVPQIPGLWANEMVEYIKSAFEREADVNHTVDANAEGGIHLQDDKIIASHVVHSDMRMFLQQGTFTMHTTDKALEEMPNAERFLRKLIIRKGTLHEFKTALRVLGINRSNIYPDLTNLAKQIKYSR